MAHYTGEKLLSLDDLKRLRDKYNSAGEFSDRSFMNELFHGLDGIINTVEQCTLDEAAGVLVRDMDDYYGVDKKHESHATRSSDASSFDEICIKCGAKDISGGGWGDLAKPCKFV